MTLLNLILSSWYQLHVRSSDFDQRAVYLKALLVQVQNISKFARSFYFHCRPLIIVKIPYHPGPDTQNCNTL